MSRDRIVMILNHDVAPLAVANTLLMLNKGDNPGRNQI